MASSRKRWLERREYDPLDPAKQHEVESAGSVVSSFLDKKMSKGTGEVGRALACWRKVCGKRVARHTVAVWLNRPQGADLPELIVYLDGNTLMADLTTDAEMYQERLAFAGLEVERVKFRLSRKAGQPMEAKAKIAASEPVELPSLTAYEQARVEQSCSVIADDKMRAAASEAMKNSLRRSKLETTQNDKPRP